MNQQTNYKQSSLPSYMNQQTNYEQSSLPSNMNQEADYGQSSLPSYMNQQANYRQSNLPSNMNQEADYRQSGLSSNMNQEADYRQSNLPSNMNQEADYRQSGLSSNMNQEMNFNMYNKGNNKIGNILGNGGLNNQSFVNQVPQQVNQNQNMNNSIPANYNGVLPDHLAEQMLRQQNSNMPNQNVLNSLPANYSGPIPNHLMDQNLLNMIGGAKKKKRSKKNERGNKLKGGTGRLIPKYFDEKNTPFRDNETKTNDTDMFREKNMLNNNESNPIVDLKVYPEDRKPKRNLMKMLPAPYVPVNKYPAAYPYVTGNVVYPNLARNELNPYFYEPNTVPIINKYNISMPSPNGDHVKMSDIYEDILPKSKYNNTSNTLEERIMIHNFVRSVFMTVNDGENINISSRKLAGGGKTKNILSYLKLLDINPYHINNDVFGADPYLSTSDSLLIYHSCYPIRYDDRTGAILCARNSIGLNCRLYELSLAELNASSVIDNHLNPKKFDIWREIAFYEIVRENILKKKVCPNFVMLYGYFLSDDSGLDFEKIRNLKKNKINKQKSNNQKSLDDLVNNQYYIHALDPLNAQYKQLKEGKDGIDYAYDNDKKETGKINKMVGPITNPKSYEDLRQIFDLNNRSDKKVSEIIKSKIDIHKKTNTIVLALTEGPNYNIKDWAKRTYRNNDLGPVKTMIKNGFHNSEVWRTIIFQLLAALQALYLNKIALKDMKIEDNVYIKDLMTYEKDIGYWKYIVGEFEYFIPNYGFLLQIDSNFKDIVTDNRTIQDISKTSKIDKIKEAAIKKLLDDPKLPDQVKELLKLDSTELEISDKSEYKIYGDEIDIIRDDAEKQELQDKINSIQYDNLKNIFIHSSLFSRSFSNEGGMPPPEDIHTLVESIKTAIIAKPSDKQDGNLEDIISENFKDLLNNRLGTLLKHSERQAVSWFTSPKLVVGKMYIYDINTNPQFVILKSIEEDDKCVVFTRELDKHNKPITESTKQVSQLYDFDSTYSIDQDYKFNRKFNIDNLLETYVLKN